MRLLNRIILIVACMTMWMPLSISSAAEQAVPSVVIVTVKGEIDGGQSSLLHRAFQEAEKNSAQAIIVELDTFGGLVDAAVQMRDLIIDSPIPTICYIKNRAWSAGALIALAHQNIVIAPGGSIGAAEPIPTTEKTVAALKAEFAATANKTGRNPRVAEAMVDKSLGLPGYAEPGQILALTDYQAREVGFADLVATDRAVVLSHYGLTGATVIEYQPQWMDRMAGWLSNPAIKSGLLSLIFLAVLAEIKTAGMGVGALIAIVAAMLFFGSQWLTGVAGLLEVLLFIGGCVLVVIELYVPGMGLFGIAGLASILASFFLSLGANLSALTTMAISLLIAVIVFLLLARYLPSSKLWARLVLKDSETTQAGYTSAEDYNCYIGCEGTTITQLRPAGTIEVNGVQLDVVSEGRFLPRGIQVRVVSVKGNRIVVHPIGE